MIHYYFEKEGKVVGPLSFAALAEKNIQSTTLIWRHGFNNWTPAEQIEELNSFFSRIPPPLPTKKEAFIKEIPEKKELSK